MSKLPYVGRFAPSPTGPLHFGSLLAAIASYLEARRHGGRWLVRIEDIDPPRAERGATDDILAALEAYGFEWDGELSYQSTSHAAHLAALEALGEAGQTYRCGCSRRDLSACPSGPLGRIYPGTCRKGSTAAEYAVRVRTHTTPIAFEDGLQGQVSQSLESESGDFVVLRRDGLIAYHLAVVVDDYLQGVTDIVRGLDLMDSTARQIHLQRLLGYPSPAYMHIPVATNARGQKLSKSHGAQGVSLDDTAKTLCDAFTVLGQTGAETLHGASIAELWDWGKEYWDISVLQGMTALPVAHLPNAKTEQKRLTDGPKMP